MGVLLLLLKIMCFNNGTGKDTIFLLDKRIQVYMKSLLCLSSSHKSLPPVPLGLDVIQQELEVLGCRYTNIVNLNKQVYGPIYANIFRKLLLRDEAVGKTDASLPTN